MNQNNPYHRLGALGPVVAGICLMSACATRAGQGRSILKREEHVTKAERQ